MQKPAANTHPILPQIRQRWSPFAFADRAVEKEKLRTLFEAARWAPSSFNEQPWRFITGTKDGDPETYQKLLDILTPSNQTWAGTAPVLILGIYRQQFSHNEAPNAAALYDLGQAVAYLTVQAAEEGLHVHQMGGYDRERSRSVFAVPDIFGFGAVIALGYIGDPEERLTNERQREKHRSVERPRKPLREFVLSGRGERFGEPSPLV